MRARLTLLLIVALGLAGCASRGMSILTTAANGAPEELPSRVSVPDGIGPFPAVVILHDCSGLGPTSSGAPARWARDLVARGYVVLMPDSFSERGFPNGVCTDPSPSRAEVSPFRRVRDAYAALDYLRKQAFVDPNRIAVMGGSHGGLTTLAAMVLVPERPRESPRSAAPRGFAAAVALYPGCAARLGNWRADGSGVYRPVAPVLILIGEKDDWTPAAPCRELTEASRRAGYPVSIKVYPGAHHAFDSYGPERYLATRVNVSSPSGRGATTGGNPTAWNDSIREVAEFFDRHLNAK
jgi:dienelactone hydrolase